MENITRRGFLKLAGSAALGLALGKANILPAMAQAPVVGSQERRPSPVNPAPMPRSITPSTSTPNT